MSAVNVMVRFLLSGAVGYDNRHLPYRSYSSAVISPYLTMSSAGTDISQGALAQEWTPIPNS